MSKGFDILGSVLVGGGVLAFACMYRNLPEVRYSLE
jgi:hypothetical protein